MKSLFRIIKTFFSPRIQYYSIIALDEEKKEKSVRLGVQSLIMAIVGLALFALLLYLGTPIGINFKLSLTGDAGFPIFSFFGMMICYCGALVPLFGGVMESLIFAIYQCRANKHKIGLASKIISLVCFALAIAGIIAVAVVLSRA